MIEPLFVGVKAAVIASMAVAACHHASKKNGNMPVIAAAIALLIAPFALYLPESLNAGNVISRLSAYEFILLYIAAALSIRLSSDGRFSRAAMLFLPAVYLLPDFAGSALHLRETALMRGNAVSVFATSTAGFIALSALFIRFRRNVLSPDFGAFFGLPQTLLFLAVMRLLLGGAGGGSGWSIIPAMQALTMKFVHDVVHHVFSIILVPDHPLLRVTVWNFIGFFFGPNFSMMVTAGLLVTPPVMFVKRILFAPDVDGHVFETAAERRLYRADVRLSRRKEAAAGIVFIAVILAAWFIQGGESPTTRYNPAPKPVVEDKGVVVIPLKDPTMNLKDGAIHKFSLARDDGSVMRLLVTARSDGSLAVCLDACEICPPDGYGQSGKTVICLFCDTPIPTDTLGKAGGCNPIPVRAEVTAADIRISVAEIVDKWRRVNMRANAEGGR
ncbi:MAG: DUF2318 domain-containing protein [Nitrospirae bacterium]|nr:DUF2318 domain-containing protein [Nitrospirota bacterium]